MCGQDVSALSQSDFRKGGGCCIVDRLFAIGTAEKAIACLIARLHSQGHILQRGKTRKHRSDLEGSGQAELCPLVDGQCGDVNAVESDGPRCWREESGNLLYQRGFAGTVWSDDSVQLAGADVERHAIGHDKSAEVLVQVIKLKHWVRHG